MTVPPERKDRNILELSEQGANEEQISMAVERVRVAVRPSTAALPENAKPLGQAVAREAPRLAWPSSSRSC